MPFAIHRSLKPMLRAALLGAALACAWIVAPALSAQPYLPPAQDFGQPLAGVDRTVAPAARDGGDTQGDEGPVTHVSGVMVAPARFDLAGLAGETRHYELRARETGGEWTGWIEVGSGDPVWFGGAEELQLRTRGWRPDGRIHYVNVSGDATATESALTAIRGEVSHVSVAAVEFIAGEPAEAELDRPAVVSREEWGAERRRGGCEPRKRPNVEKVKAAVVHHTVSASRYTRAEAPAMVLAICRYHRNGNGWNDIGYNGVVDRFGTFYEGRDGGLRKAIEGAHAEGFNDQTTGIASLGTHTDESISREATRTLADFLAWKLVQHGRDAAGRTTLRSGGGSANRYPAGKRVRVFKVIGHRRLGLTECPGAALYRDIERLRRKVQRRIDAAGGVPDDGGGGGSGGVGGG
jgi:hypothetical protein